MTTVRNLAAGVRSMTSNAFLVEGERPALVDAGDGFDLVERVEEHVDGLAALVLTHTHPDHVGNVDDVVAAFDVDVWGFDSDHPLVDRAVADGDALRLGDDDFEALHTPGHKDDHVCLYAADPGLLFAGDLVFADGGFGRTDLAEGDRATLVDSIERLREAVDGSLSAMYAGHGPAVETDPSHDIELAARTARTG